MSNHSCLCSSNNCSQVGTGKKLLHKISIAETKMSNNNFVSATMLRIFLFS